jgi:hypothetical protein
VIVILIAAALPEAELGFGLPPPCTDAEADIVAREAKTT